ncbi:FAD-dependent oxidoreductase [Amycolatopsis sp. cmx-4-83]|uniref:FAD-dependent oxidoreductase n=1 Tax=Amycolatopsis sp. cmx-4-83 TaxID=2790940 RepID=UPI00397CBB8F
MAGWDHETDVLVLGAGAAGLTAAVVAARAGLSTLVAEKSEWVGGTTARSAGTVWIPGHRQQADPRADVVEATRYLDALVGDRSQRDLRTAYLRHAPEALERLRRLGIGFRHTAGAVDYHPEVPGAGIGRALEPEPFDGRRLGRRALGRIRRPIREFALLGGTLMLRRAEADELAAAFTGQPVRAAATAGRLGLRWLLDRAGGYPRGTRLTMGNALVAALYERLTAISADVWFTAHAAELVVDERGRVEGAVVHRRGTVSRVRARRGVVLACGGFAANPALRAEYLPEPVPQFTPAVPEATGDGLRLAQSVSGALGAAQDENAMWFPGSVGRRRDGSTAVFPHIWDRAKPGIVAVDGAGRGFVDESVSYHRFVRAMYAAGPGVAVPAWLVTDAAALRTYGLGLVRPYLPGAALRRHLDDGYLRSGRSVRALAAEIGADPEALAHTVAARGTVSRPPFYAVAVFPTPLATTLGVRTDTDARVLSGTGEPVPGLYACGDDAHFFTASEYPGPGCRVGSAVTFGYLAARHAARDNLEGNGL